MEDFLFKFPVTNLLHNLRIACFINLENFAAVRTSDFLHPVSSFPGHSGNHHIILFLCVQFIIHQRAGLPILHRYEQGTHTGHSPDTFLRTPHTSSPCGFPAAVRHPCYSWLNLQCRFAYSTRSAYDNQCKLCFFTE